MSTAEATLTRPIAIGRPTAKPSSASPSPNPLVTTIFFGAIAFLYLPLLYVMFQAFLVDPNDITSGLTLHWMARLFESGALWEPLLNSLLIGIMSASLAAALGTVGAVGLSSLAGALPAWLRTLIMLPILLPEVITGLSLLLFFLLLRLPLGFATVVIAHASFSASFVFYVVMEQLKKLDPHMTEAAQDLGATPKEIFWLVTLPNIAPGVLGGWLIAFTLSFDDFLISFFTSGTGLTTLPLKIYSLMRIGISPELNGLSFLMIVLSSALVLGIMSREQGRKWMLKR